MTAENTSVEPALDLVKCPENLKSLIEDTSFETLVSWKMQSVLRQNADKNNNLIESMIKSFESAALTAVLAQTSGNQSKAADLLGINRNTVRRRLSKEKIDPKNLRKSLQSKNKLAKQNQENAK